MKKLHKQITQKIAVFISKTQVLIIKKIFSRYIIDEDKYDDYTSVFDDDIRSMKKECRTSVACVQSHFFMDTDDGAELIHEAFDELPSRTKTNALLFRYHNLDQDGRSIYSTSMNWDFVAHLSGGTYSDIQCIFVPKGARIIPTASVVRCSETGSDSEFEIIVDARYARKIGAHLWLIHPD